MRQNDDRELVPLKSDFDVVWRGFRRSQVQFYIQQTETEVRMMTEDRDSALGQVGDLTTQLDQAREEAESLRQQLDAVCKTPVDESALSDRLRRMVRLANDEASDVVASARAAAEHEWSRSEQAAAELRARYERLVAEADEWRNQAEVQRREALEQTRQDIEKMSHEAEKRRRQLDVEAEERRSQVEHDFEVSMAARRDESMRVLAERDKASRDEAERRIREAAADAEYRAMRATQQVEAMRELRQNMAGQLRSAEELLGTADEFLSASVAGEETEAADAYVAEHPPASVAGSSDSVSDSDSDSDSAIAGDSDSVSADSTGDAELTVPRQREADVDSDGAVEQSVAASQELDTDKAEQPAGKGPDSKTKVKPTKKS